MILNCELQSCSLRNRKSVIAQQTIRFYNDPFIMYSENMSLHCLFSQRIR